MGQTVKNHCPDCGAAIKIETCPGCGATAEYPEDAHFPLWRLRVSIESGGKRIKDQAAFRRLVPGWKIYGFNQDPEKPISLYIPAWGNRLTPKFSLISKRYIREQPELHAVADRVSKVIRSIFGPREAGELAMLSLLGVCHQRPDSARLILGAHLKVEAEGLVLLPFKKGHHEWHDAVSGSAVPLGEVTERRM